ncbi:hypothetical protein IQ226_01190 [Dolichospermum sp. LEGE 00240]|jgi:hypothetical protein|uniref:hypothetical protein n=1 Tax=Dolichospermum sp. LEGE 00240 TaxID=1828603 RepID=UPI00187FA97C|nr:hypothetical protein [Dolichospermum sp. LEGE 00240]MDM3844831.1 hypothetical protein [Aphanizomenon gracile PMC638.10]MDM3850192.1 hypothetical protein [Aphanizomenon gracile PMC627.10]MDM3856346.1 hypothetical protein [Aphanizomenon gracile PMC649.10]MDM3862057.1 hypothetical protein [Aphanizomenon gracile PMC644.10]MBE9247834.1 hypothetical protein [Dolichospermum sp. LEGE 00240]
MSKQIIPSQNILSDLFVELSIEEQQLLSGGHWGGSRGGWFGRRPIGWGWRPRRRHW